MSGSTLTSTFLEHTGLSVDELTSELAADRPESLEPLPSLLPAEGVVARRVGDVVALARKLKEGKLDVAGARGCARPFARSGPNR